MCISLMKKDIEPMVSNRRTRSQSIHLWSPDFEKEPQNIKWNKESISTNAAGITGYQHVEE